MFGTAVERVSGSAVGREGEQLRRRRASRVLERRMYEREVVEVLSLEGMSAAR